MNSLEMKSPGLAGTKTGAGTEGITRENTTGRNVVQGSRAQSSLLIKLAAWLVRLEKGKLERKISAIWNPRLSHQLDQLLEIGDRLADYRNPVWRRP